MLTAKDFTGAAKRIEDVDLPRIGATIGAGEDILHVFIEVETRGTGFDKHGRPIILFEPHVFYRNLRGTKRRQAVEAGLAYLKWGERPYPKDSYPRLLEAIKIDETAALKSCSWGMGQLLGENHVDCGYATVQDMVRAFCEDEDNHLEAMVNFIIAKRLDDDLRRIEAKADRGEVVTAADWIPVVRVYNGKGFARNDYHNRAARAWIRWRKIKDTPYAKNVDVLQAAAAEDANWQHAAVTAIDTAAPLPADPATVVPASNVDAPATVAPAQSAAPAPVAATAEVEIKKVEATESPILRGIRTHYAAAFAFITTSGAGLIAMLKGLPPALIYGFFGAAALIACAYIWSRVWLGNKENDRQLERDRMAHELTLAAIKTASDPNSLTVKVTK